MWGGVFAGCAAFLAIVASPVMADVDLAKLSVTPNPRLGLAFPGSQTRYYRAIAEAGIGAQLA